MQAGLGVAEVAHHVDEVNEFGCFEGEDPLVVVHAECCDGVCQNLREVDCLHAVVLEHFCAAFGVHVVPVVGAYEGVDADPCFGCLAACVGGCVVAGELCFAVYAHGGPDDGGACEECGAADLADCCLQLFGGCAVGPDHDVCVVAHCGDVVDAAQGHALCCELFYDLLELGACLVGVGLCGACAGACEHSVQGVVQGFAFFATAAVLVSCGVLDCVALGCAAVAVACVGVAAVAVCCVIVRHCVFLSSARVRCAGGAASVAARFLNFLV
ncbi:hypothetical protein RMDY18_06270 [Rothia mucilaginosa DY-18]|uniref:Uncharacterized protein n=1 Tax=Rothia mucilaginosa (strain DY-18) TaxID=680646 RepID=D2NS33_ROTMD|nr:hypothetical protein RMDY18_06270 [Rothia mucilaginosa DY-18]